MNRLGTAPAVAAGPDERDVFQRRYDTDVVVVRRPGAGIPDAGRLHQLLAELEDELVINFQVGARMS